MLDNIWPPHNPDFPPDPEPASTRLQNFASASCKILDGAVHSFRQEIVDHEKRVEDSLHDLHANRLDPDSYVSAEGFERLVTATINPYHEAFCKDLAAIRTSYDNMKNTMEAANWITVHHKNALATQRDCLDQANTAHTALQADLACLEASFTSALTNVSTTNASVVLHVNKLASAITSFDSRLASVESTLAPKVILSTDSVPARLTDMGVLLTSQISVPNSTVSALVQRLPSLTHLRAPLVMPSPVDTSPEPPANTQGSVAPPGATLGSAPSGTMGVSTMVGNKSDNKDDSAATMGAKSEATGDDGAESAFPPNN
jgi:hypothetical protein